MSDSVQTRHRAPARSIAVAAFAMAAALACTSPPPSGPSYPEQLSRWEGESEAHLITTWGMPQQTHVLADGGRIVEYRTSGEDERTCTTRFTLDPSGTIVRWWYVGASCSAPKTAG